MWALFLLIAMTVAVCAMALVYVGNKVFLAIKKDQEKEITKEEKEME